MKLSYFFCDTPLGVLRKTKSGYSYTSNIENEQALRMTYRLTESEYTLWNSYQRESNALFPDILEVLRKCLRKDLLIMADVSPQDTEWEILVKVSSLPAFTSGFYLKPTEDEIATK